MPTLRKVLFLCVGNSCRSQMAEAIVNARMADHWQAFSAGSQPEGYVHPKALQVLNEIGIQHQGESVSVEQFIDHKFDLVVTVCDAEAENCPVWLGTGRQVHQPFDDPFNAQGTEEEILAVYRRVLNKIESQIPTLINKFS